MLRGGRHKAVRLLLIREIEKRARERKAPLTEMEARLTILELARRDYRVEAWLTEKRVLTLLRILERKGVVKGRLKLG